jgi:hypothetical protein
MIQVIDIRKHDPEKVIEYWINKGGIDIGCGRSNAYPYVGIDRAGNINGFVGLQEKHCLIDLPTEPQLISGKEYAMRNGEKAYFVGTSKQGHNVFEQNGGLWLYDGLAYCGCDFNVRDFDIILEPEKKEPRTIYVNEFDGTVEGSFAWLTEEDAKAAVSPRHKNPRTIKFVEVIEN